MLRKNKILSQLIQTSITTIMKDKNLEEPQTPTIMM